MKEIYNFDGLVNTIYISESNRILFMFKTNAQSISAHNYLKKWKKITTKISSKDITISNQRTLHKFTTSNSSFDVAVRRGSNDDKLIFTMAVLDVNISIHPAIPKEEDLLFSNGYTVI
jgi:hypothetical protein